MRLQIEQTLPLKGNRTVPLRDEFLSLRKAFSMTGLWWRASVFDIRLRYRRSILGPAWITLSMVILMLILGFLYSELFRVPVRTYLPYVGVSLVCWTMIATIGGEAPLALVQNAHVVKNMAVPPSVFALGTVARNLLIFLHNAVVLVPLYVIFPEYLSWALLGVVPALAVFLLNASWVAVVLSYIGARFRDVPQIVTNLIVAAFFLTPVFWPAEAVGTRRFVLDWNPFFHILEVLRRPLLGELPSSLSIVVSLALPVAGWGLALLVSRRYRKHIAFFV